MPLQSNLLRSAPSPTSVKQCGLKARENRGEQATCVRCSATGRPFQAVGPAMEKARHCRITVLVRGTSIITLVKKVKNSAWKWEIFWIVLKKRSPEKISQKNTMRNDAEKSWWGNIVPRDRLVLAPLYSAEPAQKCCTQCAVGRGASEGHPAYTQRFGRT